MEPQAGRTPSESEPELAEDVRDWSELPLDALVQVFSRLGAVEILMGTSLVCHSWQQASKQPELWSTLDMSNHSAIEKLSKPVLLKMAMAAVARSGTRRLEAFSGRRFVTDDLLRHISSSPHTPAASPSSLRTLSLVSCHGVTNRGFTALVARCPLLEELSLELCPSVGGRGALERAGRACPRLRSFSLRRECFRFSLNYSRRAAEALGIAAAMPALRSLTLVCSNVTNEELAAVLDGCRALETLCLRDCYKVIADAELRARCAGIRTLTLPDDRV